jgi:hypothetical protein
MLQFSGAHPCDQSCCIALLFALPFILDIVQLQFIFQTIGPVIRSMLENKYNRALGVGRFVAYFYFREQHCIIMY